MCPQLKQGIVKYLYHAVANSGVRVRWVRPRRQVYLTHRQADDRQTDRDRDRDRDTYKDRDRDRDRDKVTDTDTDKDWKVHD